MTALYRHFDENGALLYVGISVNAAARTSAHSKSAPWFNSVVRIEIEQHLSYRDALNAEAVAIVIERPIHNRMIPLRRAMRLVSPVESWPTLRARYRIDQNPNPVETPPQILDFIGQSRVRRALSVKDDAVRKALKSGVLPASWYNTLEQLAGRPLPRSLFSFKGTPE